MGNDRMKDPFDLIDEADEEENKNEEEYVEEEVYKEDEETPPTVIKLDANPKEYSSNSFRSPFKLAEKLGSSVHTCQKIVAANDDRCDALDLISAHFNGYDTIYLLTYSAKDKKLYIARFNCNNHEFSNFRPLTIELDEEMYNAVVYRETEQLIDYYLQGKEKIWKLQLDKPNFNITSMVKDQKALKPFAYTLYPFDKKGDPARDLEAASLLTYNMLPVCIGGKDTVVKGNNLARRLIAASVWRQESESLTLAPGFMKANFLIEKRQSPFCFINGDKLLCVGGNVENPNNVAECIDLKDCFMPTAVLPEKTNENQLIVPSLQNDALNNALNSVAPRSASCLHENSIYLFSSTIAEQTSLVFYKFNLSNHCWQVLSYSENIVAEDLRYSSAKAVAMDNFIFLFLFDKSNQKNGTGIKILKISLLNK